MKSKEHVFGMLLAAAIAAGDIGCGGGPPPPISVSVSNTTATVEAGTTVQFTATVSNDSRSQGVTWTVSCSAGPPCGTVSPTSTASGAPTTYTPPARGISSTVTLTATSVSDPTKSATVMITVPAFSVSIAPPTAGVGPGSTAMFTATVTGDGGNKGVTWTVSCSAASCGSVSPTATASGTATTYTAPIAAPAENLTQVLIFASPVTNSSTSFEATITILPISVSVSPTSASVALNATRQFTATVTNDGTNSGVTWTLTQNGAACSPGCGTISPTSSASGAAVTYTAPATAPALPAVTITATSVEDTTKSASATVTLTTSTGSLACGAGSGSESLFKGQYGFLLLGNDSQGGTALAGSFSADGSGKITAGEEDTNSSSTVQTDAAIDPTASFYAVGPDRRGCVALAISGGPTTYFRFALGSLNSSSIATAGHIVEFDDTTGTGARAAGTIRLQDAASFTASQFKGNYAVGFIGVDGLNARLAIAATFTSDGVSALPAGTFDINDGGGITNDFVATSAGSFSCCSANGRGTLTLPGNLPIRTSLGNEVFTTNLAFYMINSSDVFLVNSGFGQYSGEAIGIPPATTFSQSSLNGASALRETAQSSSGPLVDIATASSNGTGAMTVNDNINNAGTFTSSSTALNYVVASNGRVTLSGGSTPPVLYLFGQNQGFLLGNDPNVTFGILEAQATGPLSNSSFSGVYMLGTENSSAGTVTLESGVLAANGNGNAAGTTDQSSPTGLTQSQNVNFAYSFSTNGVGNVGSGTTAILISPNKLVFINNTSTNPTITVAAK